MRVRWLRTALSNLDDEAAYIARDDPEAAPSTVEKIRQAVDHLTAHPEIGRPGRVSGTRELVVAGTPYIIPYRVKRGSVEILRVFSCGEALADAPLSALTMPPTLLA